MSLISSAFFLLWVCLGFFFPPVSDRCSVWFFITGFTLVTGYYEAFQGCWKLLKSLLKSASLTVLTLQDFQQGLCSASSPFLLGFPSGISALPEHLQPGTAETVNTGDPPPVLYSCTFVPLSVGEICTCCYMQMRCSWTTEVRLCWKRYWCWAIPRDLVVGVL